MDDPAKLFARLHEALAPGGMIYVEDFFSLGDFSAEEQALLDDVIYARSLPTRERYMDNLEGAGFRHIRFQDMTDRWRPYVIERAAAYGERLHEQAALHGREISDALDNFYRGVATLFAGGAFGGLRITARRD